MRKAILDFPGYEVDELGNVWSTGFKNGNEKILNPGKSNNGYLVVRLARDKKYITCLVHILVCETFHGPKPEGLEVRHLDGNSHNPRADNLAWGTTSENQLDRRLHGTSPQGENHPKAILTEGQVLEIRELLAHGYRTVDIARIFGVSRYAISDIKRGKNWTHIK